MKKHWIGVGLITLIIISCQWTNFPALEWKEITGCYPMPEDFLEIDLVGIWREGAPGHTDELIIKADGTYKQSITVELSDGSSIYYESLWHPWYITKSDENLTYLHLEDYSFCGMNPDIPCDIRNGGGYDFCREESMNMENEGILIVLASFGPNERPLPGTEIPNYSISLIYPSGSENSYSYNLLPQNP